MVNFMLYYYYSGSEGGWVEITRIKANLSWAELDQTSKLELILVTIEENRNININNNDNNTHNKLGLS